MFAKLFEPKAQYLLGVSIDMEQGAEGSHNGVEGGRGIQRSHSNHRQQHFTPILKIKIDLKCFLKENLFSMFGG